MTAFNRSAAMEKLVGVVQALSQVRTVDAVAEIVRHAARDLTGADGATFVLRDGERCYYVDEDAIAPLWKGQRFPMSACISGWAMLNARSVVIEDIYADPRIPADAYRPTFVKSLAMIPIRQVAPLGAIGNYWATMRTPSAEEIEVLQALANSTSVALENAQLYADLQEKIAALSAREALIREQRDTLDVFARSLAHDLKEPAHLIHSFSHMLEARTLADEAREKYTHFVHDAGARLSMLIDVVFDYTQLDPSQVRKADFDLGDAFAAAADELAEPIKARAAIVACDHMPMVRADQALMAQVFRHLIGNTLAHGPEGVRVMITARTENGAHEICVRDDGPGIAPEHHKKIFEPFGRLGVGADHAGMGLALCRKIIDYHGGAMRCESAPGQGAAFYFTLPQHVSASDALAAA